MGAAVDNPVLPPRREVSAWVYPHATNSSALGGGVGKTELPLTPLGYNRRRRRRRHRRRHRHCLHWQQAVAAGDHLAQQHRVILAPTLYRSCTILF